MNLAMAFSETAARHPSRSALFWGEEEHFYAQLWRRSAWIGERLCGGLGVQPGVRVALWMRNCPQFVPAFFGVLHAGGVVVPVNNFLKPEEVLHILDDAGVDVLIADESMSDGTARLAEARPRLRVLHVEEMPESPVSDKTSASETGNGRTESDLAVLIYTSGTTGRPKGAMLSHGNLLHNVASCREMLACVGEDRFVVLLPMFHSFMMTVGILLPLLTGGSMVLAKSVHPVRNVVEEIIRRRATILPAVPQFFRAFMHPQVPANLPLRLCISGGAPLPGEILREFSAKFPFPLLEGYGLSEASPVVTFNPIDRQKPGSIGRPISGVEVSVQNEQGGLLPIGEAGEVCVRGGNVMQGYWNQPQETAAVIRNGWLLTGDIGHADAEGFFYITDRKKDMLLVNGINVYPREIEEVLYRFEGVKEASVVGVPDQRKGEQPTAFVSAFEGTVLDEKALQQFVRERLADYKVPRRITVLPSLPRNMTGKILKTALREIALQNSGSRPPQ